MSLIQFPVLYNWLFKRSLFFQVASLLGSSWFYIITCIIRVLLTVVATDPVTC